MSNVPIIPENAPFTPEQRAWLNGFLAGVFSRAHAPTVSAVASASQPLAPLTILFGSQTGTAEGLAKRAAKEAGKRGFAATVVDTAQFDSTRLASEKNLLLITSTFGDGEPPDNAKAFHAALRSEAAPKLSPELRFSVCGLGDTNYSLFNQCAKDFDAALEKLGATRAAPRVDCDLEYEEPFVKWLDSALASLGTATTVSAPSPAPEKTSAPAATEGFSKKNPFPAPLVARRCLNAAGSAKEVNHIEFSLEGSSLSYEAGDALGVISANCPELVAEVLATLGCDGEEAVATPVGELPLRTALLTHFDLGKPSADLLAALSLAKKPVAAGAVAEKDAPQILDVLDALKASSTRLDAKAFAAALKKLQPRLYSISSSPKAHPGQVHLTVGAVRYEIAGRARKGVCSTFLAERLALGGATGVFVHSNKAFRLPAKPETPVIMVGPGTGIAPFRAFLEERKATGASGKNWLFFGDQRASTDFLYSEELEAMRTSGVLTRLDLAWSRDQNAKVYVQNRMLENGAELWAWLEAGAHFYVCGDASRMAKDVDAALHTIAQTVGGLSQEKAAEYVQALKTQKRYQRDVY